MSDPIVIYGVSFMGDLNTTNVRMVDGGIGESFVVIEINPIAGTQVEATLCIYYEYNSTFIEPLPLILESFYESNVNIDSFQWPSTALFY